MTDIIMSELGLDTPDNRNLDDMDKAYLSPFDIIL